jgi:hypothetical protein
MQQNTDFSEIHVHVTRLGESCTRHLCLALIIFYPKKIERI